jgi:hypothetical protein
MVLETDLMIRAAPTASFLDMLTADVYIYISKAVPYRLSVLQNPIQMSFCCGQRTRVGHALITN